MCKWINDVDNSKSDQTKKDISMLLHEASQPLMVINAYVSACLHLLQNNTDSNPQLLAAINKINDHANLAGEKIHEMRNFIENNLSLETK